MELNQKLTHNIRNLSKISFKNMYNLWLIKISYTQLLLIPKKIVNNLGIKTNFNNFNKQLRSIILIPMSKNNNQPLCLVSKNINVDFSTPCILSRNKKQIFRYDTNYYCIALLLYSLTISSPQGHVARFPRYFCFWYHP